MLVQAVGTTLLVRPEGQVHPHDGVALLKDTRMIVQAEAHTVVCREKGRDYY